ncbi:hypothetical protein GL267_000965 [Acidithiobacillus ferrianus]|uniref:Uncharacterized protein n=2 Tax=Acidithiobacillus ferrianus TaxID=2678518 RepID=A0A845U1Z3_9PROT|nr:hypothetical protein [Acidithiobacillus ferrianus]NDU41622.1 hypothetical protein [Acidithiobacillus ferrianus]
MKMVYALVIIGALALFTLFLWWARGPVDSVTTRQGSTGWYVQHPDALAVENLKCWKLLQAASFADVDKVMAEHPHCRAVYEAIQKQDSAHAD